MSHFLKIFAFILIVLIPESSSSQDVIHRFGKSTFCKVDSNTTQIYVAAKALDEGINFIIDDNGKVCSSGKVSTLEDYEIMKTNLYNLKETHNITLNMYNTILCQIEKEEEVKIYHKNNMPNIKEQVVLEILSRRCD